MAMGQRKCERQETFWVPTDKLPQTPGHLCLLKTSSRPKIAVSGMLASIRD